MLQKDKQGDFSNNKKHIIWRLPKVGTNKYVSHEEKWYIQDDNFLDYFKQKGLGKKFLSKWERMIIDIRSLISWKAVSSKKFL